MKREITLHITVGRAALVAVFALGISVGALLGIRPAEAGSGGVPRGAILLRAGSGAGQANCTSGYTRVNTGSRFLLAGYTGSSGDSYSPGVGITSGLAATSTGGTAFRDPEYSWDDGHRHSVAVPYYGVTLCRKN